MIAKAFSTGNWNTFKNFVDVVLPSTMKKIQSVFVPKIDSVLNSMLGSTTEVRKESVVVSELIESRQFVGIGVTLTYGIDDFRVPEAPQAAIDSDVNAFLNQVERTLNLANDPTGQNLSMREILQLARSASSIKTNYIMFKDAQKALDSEDA